MTRAAVAALGALLVATSSAFAAPPPGSSLEDRRIYYAQDAIDKASKQVERDHACRQRPPERGPIDGAPSATFLNSLAVLRRPARPGEDVSLLPDPLPFVPSVYRDYVRVIPLPNGDELRIFPQHDISIAGPRPKRCVAELRRRVKHAIADRPRAFKRIAARLLRGEIRSDWRPRQQEGLLALQNTGGGPVSLDRFRRYGAFRFGGAPAGGNLSTFYGLVPDGVATIDFTFRRFEPTGYWSKHHPVTHRSTGTVVQNVVTFTAPGTLRDGTLNDQVWRAADGRVIRVIRG